MQQQQETREQLLLLVSIAHTTRLAQQSRQILVSED
jgi:hypothetical protein